MLIQVHANAKGKRISRAPAGNCSRINSGVGEKKPFVYFLDLKVKIWNLEEDLRSSNLIPSTNTAHRKRI